MINDLRFGFRMLLKSPAFTAVAVLTLALGIGANTAIFQLLNAVRLKQLPIRGAQELAQIRLRDSDAELTRGSKGFIRYGSVTNPLWEQIRQHHEGFSGVAAWSAGGFNLAQGGEVRIARGLWVSGEFFNLLGVQPEVGRLFNEADDVRGCTPSAVISHGFWQSEFGGARDVVGRKLILSDRPLEVIGVTPPGFFGLEVGKSFDVAFPICADPLLAGVSDRLDSGTHWWLMITGRLKPGTTIQQASAQLTAFSSDLFKQTLPSNYPAVSVNNYLNSKLVVTDGSSGYSMLREDYERPLWLLQSIAGVVLLITCANLANLLLARASTRSAEIAIRQAVGASRSRIIRQLLVETLLLAVIGTALGALLAQLLTRFLVASIGTSDNTVFLNVTPDLRVLGFTAGVTALTCILFGLTPALRATRINPGAAMKSSRRGLTAGRERFSLRRALVVVQVALSLVLVASALLFSRSLNKLLTLDTGFSQEKLLIARVGFSRLKVDSPRRLAVRAELLDRLRHVPGVDEISEMDTVPLTGGGRGNEVWLDGKDPNDRTGASFNRVDGDYLKTLKIPLLAGRTFGPNDTLNAPQVAIINQTLAKKLGEANPVGKRLVIEPTPGEPETYVDIVGLARDAKFEDLREEDLPMVYLASTQDHFPNQGRRYLVRSNLPPAQLTSAINRSLMEFNPGLDVSFQVFKTMVQESLMRDRLMAKLSVLFGGLALLVASVGLYGVLSYGVASRTNEIGIRMALGAGTHNVLSLVLREAILLVLIGVVVGVPVVLVTARFAKSLLFELSPTDPLSLVGAGLVMISISLLAAYLPARRATKIDPLVALRYE